MRGALAALAAVGALIGVAEAGGAAVPRACPPRGAHVLTQGRLAVAFGGQVVSACLRPHGPVRRLFSNGLSLDGADVRVAGRFAAWDWDVEDLCKSTDCQPEDDLSVKTIDLRSGRRRASGDVNAIGVLRLASNGVAVWTDDTGSGVVTVDTLGPGETKRLDSGAIDPHSLRLAGLTAHWTKDGAPLSASLAPLTTGLHAISDGRRSPSTAAQGSSPTPWGQCEGPILSALSSARGACADPRHCRARHPGGCLRPGRRGDRRRAR